MTTRRGAGKVGCLIWLVIAAAVIYVAQEVGQVYWRFYQYEDDMRQQIRYASKRSNDQIMTHLRATVDSLGLPEGAKSIAIRRTDRLLSLEADYYEHIELPKFSRDIHFHPHAEGPP